MSVERLLFFSFLLTLSLVGSAAADLIGWWTLDEGSGTTAFDASGNGNDGTLIGDPTWDTEEGHGGILVMDGVDDHMVVEGAYVLPLYSAAVWFRMDGGSGPRNIFGAYGAAGERYGASMQFEADGRLRYVHRFPFGSSGGTNIFTDTTYSDGVWFHGAIVKTPDTMTLYVNGAIVGTADDSTQFDQTALTVVLSVLRHDSLQRFVTGALDDLQLYNHALSAEEVQQAMTGIQQGQASKPNPTDGATDVLRDSVLAWKPGKYAATHDVYFGTELEEVNTGTVPTGSGLDVDSFDPGPLGFGTTYFWRVDEVNAAPDFSVHTGEVWSFTVEPFSIPVTNITATASSSFGASVAENTINGSGLVDDLHGTSATDMWISGGIPATIEYAFDRAYKLHEMWVWNSNQTIEPFIGFGAKDIVIEHSLDGENWTALEGVGPLAQAPGMADYAHNNTIDFGGAKAQHVRMSITTVQGFAPQASLSEVRFLYIPTFATGPNPLSGATDVSADVTLSWARDGREAAGHDIYLGADPNALSLAGSVTESSFDSLAADLQLGQTYYWQVVEVNDAMDPSEWAGAIWSFTTVETILVDDMESYRDEEFLEIWATWIDGFDDSANGSLVGNGAAGAPETDRVHGGSQSLPLHYDNSAAAQSEATRTFDVPMDWTGHGVASLVLYFQGSATNTGGSLYVKINDTKIAYDGDASNLMRLGWNKWTIILAEAGANLSRVNSLTVGVDSGGMGVVTIDDIQLTSDGARDLITPVEPVEGLVVYYPLDGDYQDASGNGLHGTPMGGPFFEAGQSGQAVSLNGIDQYVEITGYQGITVVNGVQQPFTVTNWFKTTENGEMVTWGASPGGQRLSWRLDGGSLRTEHGSGNLRGNTVANDGEWHHAALVVTEGATLRPNATQLYLDGLEDSTFSGADVLYNLQPDTDVSIGRRATSGDRYFPGSLDDVRIYDRDLTDAEIAWLAGRTKAFDK